MPPLVRKLTVNDGDTVTIQGRRIRLGCIDAPEISQPRGEEAKKTLQELLRNGNPKVNRLGTDRFGRTVASLEVLGRNINVEMVRRGQAFVYGQFLSSCPPAMQTELRAVENYARTRGIGVWQDNPPDYPWEFRRSKR